ncbi:MAG: transglutaminase family protein [Planctomycetota bacterium]
MTSRGRRGLGLLGLLLALATATQAQEQRAPAPDYQGGEWHLERAAGKRVVAELEGSIHAPALEAEEWLLVVAAAPRHALSSVERQWLWAETGGRKSTGRAAREPGGRELLVLRVASLPEEGKGLRYLVRYELTTAAVTLRPGPATPGQPHERANARELRQHLEKTKLFAFEDPGFAAWMRAQGLVRKDGERDLAFGYRVLEALGKGFRYAYPPKSPARTCPEVARDGASDCGGLSALAVSILRANRVPARLLVGRWVVQPQQPEEPQFHVKFELWAEGIGWVPCDGSGAVQWRGGAQAAFGRCGANFLVMHVDPDLEVDSVHWGKKRYDFLQGALWWVTGRGTLEGKQEESRWTVQVRGDGK